MVTQVRVDRCVYRCALCCCRCDHDAGEAGPRGCRSARTDADGTRSRSSAASTQLRASGDQRGGRERPRARVPGVAVPWACLLHVGSRHVCRSADCCRPWPRRQRCRHLLHRLRLRVLFSLSLFLSPFITASFPSRNWLGLGLGLADTRLSSLHCTLSLAAQCIVIGPVCVFVCQQWAGRRAGGVCYHDNSKLRASIFT